NGGKETTTIHLCDVATGKVRQIAGQPRYLRSAFAPDSKTLATGTAQGIVLWDLATGKERGRLAGHYPSAGGLTLSSDGHALAAVGDGAVRLWDVRAGTQRRAPAEGHQASVAALALLPDGKTLTSAGRDGTVRFWEAATGRPVREYLLPASASPVSTFRFAP